MTAGAAEPLPRRVLLRLLGKLGAEVGPLLAFFLAFARWGIFVAAGVYATATALALALTWRTQRRLPILPLLSSALVALFAALTVALDNAVFIQIKPTVVNGFYALALGGGWLLGFRLLRPVLAPAVVLDESGERGLTWRVAAYLACLAIANEIVWRALPLHLWVIFKVFVLVGLNLLFLLLHIPYVRRHRVASAGNDADAPAVLRANHSEDPVMSKNAALIAALCTAIAAAAAPQQAGAAEYLQVLDGDRVVPTWQVTVGELESADVYAADGEEIGDVEDVLMTANGEIVGLTAEVGGFLGLGEREIAFELDSLAWDGERVIVRMTNEQIGSLPSWE